MGTKPEVMKPKLWSNHEAESLNFSKHEAEALVFSKHEAEAEAQVLPSYYNFGFVRLRSRSLFQFTKLKLKPKLWLFETTKLKPKPKHWPQMLWLHEAEAEAAAASYPCLTTLSHGFIAHHCFWTVGSLSVHLSFHNPNPREPYCVFKIRHSAVIVREMSSFSHL